MSQEEIKKCSTCDGRGRNTRGQRCLDCNGTGNEAHDEIDESFEDGFDEPDADEMEGEV